jgi:hypothetical protein
MWKLVRTGSDQFIYNSHVDKWRARILETYVGQSISCVNSKLCIYSIHCNSLHWYVRFAPNSKVKYSQKAMNIVQNMNKM